MSKKVCFSLVALSSWLLLFESCKNKPSQERQSGFPQAAADKPTQLPGGAVGFVAAARAVTPGVVHIKTVFGGSSNSSFFDNPYERQQAPSRGSGSGVVISADGYIATNNHVIENATQIEVIFPDRRSFTGKLVGRDPDTDLALLKVDAKDLRYVALGNSDAVQVGEPVLAVGYPYSLNTTVTAGIVSAKGRSIGIINRQGSSFAEGAQGNTAVESFIQTDAAINPGNSGGALVNINGELIGINTAIASLTGSYTGYAFAVPVNLAKKILDDLKQFGQVKRGLLGVSFPSPSIEDQFFKQQGINPGTVKGVFITGVQKGSAADGAGLEEGDIIQSIDGVQLFSSAEFSELIARRRPGDKIKLDYLRNGKQRSTTATLKEESRASAAADPQALQRIYEKLGARFAPLSAELQERYRLQRGVVVTDVEVGGFFYQLGIPAGTVIAFINGRAVSTPQEIEQALVAAQNSRVQILGVAPDGSRIAFNFSLGA